MCKLLGKDNYDLRPYIVIVIFEDGKKGRESLFIISKAVVPVITVDRGYTYHVNLRSERPMDGNAMVDMASFYTLKINKF